MGNADSRRGSTAGKHSHVPHDRSEEMAKQNKENDHSRHFGIGTRDLKWDHLPGKKNPHLKGPSLQKPCPYTYKDTWLEGQVKKEDEARAAFRVEIARIGAGIALRGYKYVVDKNNGTRRWDWSREKCTRTSSGFHHLGENAVFCHLTGEWGCSEHPHYLMTSQRRLIGRLTRAEAAGSA